MSSPSRPSSAGGPLCPRHAATPCPRRPHKKRLRALALVAFALVSATCLGSDEATKGSFGEACVAPTDCDSGLCYQQVCLDPLADADADGLTNLREVAIGTDPFAFDTDQDGKGDFAETNGGVGDPPDRDADGLHDAIESAIADGDRDCIPDERDPQNDAAELDWVTVADLACCCSGRCQDVGMSTWNATCTPDENDQPLLTCILEGPEAERYPCLGLVGEACTLDRECTSGYCDGSLCATDCASDGSVCGPNARCIGRRCEPLAELGQACSRDEDCVSAFCDGNLCAADCVADPSVCPSGTWCSGRRCAPVGDNGADCTADTHCASGFCDDDTCAADCAMNPSTCGPGSRCMGRRCVPLTDDGGACGDDEECASGYCLLMVCTPDCGADPSVCLDTEWCDGRLCRPKAGLGDPCSSDAECVSGACSALSTCVACAAGGACDDGNACTHTDRCDDQGVCAGTTLNCQDDTGTCGARRVCDGTDTCAVTTPGAETSCDDGVACTYDDVCDGAGGCAGTPLVCQSEAGACGLQRVCDGTSTCAIAFPGTATSCDDGNACTYDDRCDGAGGCTGTAITCASDPGPCGAVRTCNGTASCSITYPGAATACNDGNACSHTDRCNGAGGCGGTGIACNNDPGPCGLQRACNGTATCATAYPGNNVGCDDGRVCTSGDVCNGAGSCVGTNRPNGSVCGATDIQVCCSGNCLNLAEREDHCGGCGIQCAAGRSCHGTGNAPTHNCPVPNCPNRSGRCGCNSNAECPAGQTCDLTTFRCEPTSNLHCAAGQRYYNVSSCPNFCSYVANYSFAGTCP